MKPLPKKVPEKGFDRESRIAINQLIEAVHALQPRPTESIEIDQTPNGYFLRARGGRGNDGNGNVPRWG
jgi:hypothetical protein